MVLDILTAVQGGTFAIIHTQCCTSIPDMRTNVTHFTKHVNQMIEAMDTPEASITSLWEMLTSSPLWKTILITTILIVLFLLFAPCICNCVIGFVSSGMKAFMLQKVVQALPVQQPPPTWGLWIRDSQYEGYENMVPQQFRDHAPHQQEAFME